MTQPRLFDPDHPSHLFPDGEDAPEALEAPAGRRLVDVARVALRTDAAYRPDRGVA
jgi:hypothetical protein